MAGVRRRRAPTAGRSAAAAAQAAQPALRPNPIARDGATPTGISFCSTACCSGGIEATRSVLLRSRWLECRWCRNRDNARPSGSGPPTTGDRNRGRRASAPRRPEWPRRAKMSIWDRFAGRALRTYSTVRARRLPARLRKFTASFAKSFRTADAKSAIRDSVRHSTTPARTFRSLQLRNAHNCNPAEPMHVWSEMRSAGAPVVSLE